VVFNDARTGMPPGIPGGAMCVQRFDDSLNSAIHTTYRISLRSSSMREPRDPLLKVLTFVINSSDRRNWIHEFNDYLPRRLPRDVNPQSDMCQAPWKQQARYSEWVYLVDTQNV
jgi:hypothetical protein